MHLTALHYLHSDEPCWLKPIASSQHWGVRPDLQVNYDHWLFTFCRNLGALQLMPPTPSISRSHKTSGWFYAEASSAFQLMGKGGKKKKTSPYPQYSQAVQIGWLCPSSLLIQSSWFLLCVCSSWLYWVNNMVSKVCIISAYSSREPWLMELAVCLVFLQNHSTLKSTLHCNPAQGSRTY